MFYVSTRGLAKKRSFVEVLTAGLAEDGGLYVPESLPHFSTAQLAEMASFSYEELAHKIIFPFVEGEISAADLQKIIADAYASFHHKAVAPLLQLSAHEYALELFHGPTLAFKDFALQVLGRLLDLVLQRENKRAIIVGATSGDTGSAAIMGCKNSKNVQMFILHPKGLVSEVQRRQMTSVADKNVFNIALEGNFDTCQDLVKRLFLEPPAGVDNANLVAVNSINWTRIMVQTVYYFYAALRLGAPARAVSFAIPTGNFGDAYAGFMAKKMGLPIAQLIIATNENDILYRFLKTKKYARADMRVTLAPSMDIQVASNFERLIWDVLEKNGEKVANLMQNFKQTGELSLPESAYLQVASLFLAERSDDETICATMNKIYDETGVVIDPHTATAIYAARKTGGDLQNPMVILATAHPAKFPAAARGAKIPDVALPGFLRNLHELPERYITLPADYQALAYYISTNYVRFD
jgi:threonine synthase